VCDEHDVDHLISGLGDIACKAFDGARSGHLGRDVGSFGWQRLTTNDGTDEIVKPKTGQRKDGQITSRRRQEVTPILAQSELATKAGIVSFGKRTVVRGLC
jgi:hypothetical protein